MSEEAAAGNDSGNFDNEATQSSNTCEGLEVNNLNTNSFSNCVTLADSASVTTKSENHVDNDTSDQNNLNSCFEEDDWDTEISVIADTSSQRSNSVNDSIVSNQNKEKEELKRKVTADFYIVSNENTTEPLKTSETIENIGGLEAYRDSIIEGSDDSDSSDSDSSSTVSEDDDDNDSDNNFLG